MKVEFCRHANRLYMRHIYESYISKIRSRKQYMQQVEPTIQYRQTNLNSKIKAYRGLSKNRLEGETYAA